ncbi:MAG: lipoprotein [Porticoccaceae bacterium]|jgi:predicted small lipoprotein YifL|nr:lipoprotein [Porticoccaceae bacterium]
MTAIAYRRIFLFLPLLLLVGSALNACGNKGALYIPPPPIEQPSAELATGTENE